MSNNFKLGQSPEKIKIKKHKKYTFASYMSFIRNAKRIKKKFFTLYRVYQGKVFQIVSIGLSFVQRKLKTHCRTRLIKGLISNKARNINNQE